MRSYPPAVAAHLAARRPVLTHILIRLSARHRETGALEPIGLWTGDDHREIAAGGETRTWYGAGAVIGMDMLTHRTGLEVRQHGISLSPLAPEVIEALRVYDPRLAPVSLFEWYWDPETWLALAEPVRVFRGHVISAPISTPPEGGEASCKITVASSAWALTRNLSLKRSDEALRAREPEDAFRKYGDISGAVECAWGEASASQPARRSILGVTLPGFRSGGAA